MADIQLMDLQFDTPQTTDVSFPVTVAVENNETVAPLWGADALCSSSTMAPDGHRVEVTLTVQNAAGQQVIKKTTEVCATVEQPSNVAGETRARFDIALDTAGEYTVDAEAKALYVGGQASAQPKHLRVEQAVGTVPDGTEDADRGSDTDVNPWNSTDGTSDASIPTPSSSSLLGGDLKMFAVLGVIVLVALAGIR